MASTAKNTKSNFYKFFGENFGSLCDKDKQGAREYKAPSGKSVYYQPFKSVSGKLDYIFLNDHVISDTLTIKKLEIKLIDSEGVQEVIELLFNSKKAGSFLSTLQNFKLDEEIEFIAGWDKEKSEGFLFYKQNGETVKRFNTKDTPNGCPPLEQLTVNKKLVWDSTKQSAYFEYVIDKINEQVKTIKADLIANTEF